MSTYAVPNEIVSAVRAAAAAKDKEAARGILVAEMPEMSDTEIEDLLTMILISPFANPKPRKTA
ncbi:MAG: hypothetical protein WCF85_17450 [Rhodospirillaceae bacterium]